MNKTGPNSPEKKPLVRVGALAFVLALGVLAIFLKENGMFPFASDIDTVPLQTLAEPASPGPPPRAELVDSFPEEFETQDGQTASNSGFQGSVLDRVRELVDRGESQAAAALLQEALRSKPNDVSLLMELGILLVLDLKDADKGREVFEQVVSLDPSNRLALNELSLLFMDPQHSEQGLEFLQKRISETEDATELEYAYAKLLAQTGKAADSLKHYEKAVQIKDIQDQVYIDMAEAATQAGQDPKAIHAYSKALDIQTKELARAKQSQVDAVDFIEDRIFATRIAYARTLLYAGRKDEAAVILQGVQGRDTDPTLISLRTEVFGRM